MPLALGKRICAAFAPPRYLALPFSGIDLSTSSVKAVRLAESAHGLVLAAYAEVRLPSGAFVNGEIADQPAVVEALAAAAKAVGVTAANVALPESKSFLFEAAVSGATARERRILVEQQLDEYIPLPPSETDFDIVEVGQGSGGEKRVVGIGFARRIVDNILDAFDRARIRVHALEGETFALARALLPRGDESTTLVIDVGKATTKIAVVAGRIPRFATTIGIGGHALTLAVQKHFGVTETEARRIKAERGILPSPGNEDYLATMLSTVSAIRDEIAPRLEYWQEKEAGKDDREPVSRALLVGGNASVRGLPEYLESALGIPVATGDVFANLAPRESWIPSLEYAESLAYAATIGLALYDTEQPYA